MAFSLIPSLLGYDWWDVYDYPASIADQFFGDVLVDEDLLPPSYCRGFRVRRRTRSNVEASGKSEVSDEPDVFRVSLDVSQFEPEDLEVKVVGDFVVVHAKHEEKSDEYGFIAREFTRRYVLPRDCERDEVTSTLTPDGILVVRAPKVTPPEGVGEERQIPIALE